jgi:hypothetical protein
MRGFNGLHTPVSPCFPKRPTTPLLQNTGDSLMDEKVVLDPIVAAESDNPHYIRHIDSETEASSDTESSSSSSSDSTVKRRRHGRRRRDRSLSRRQTRKRHVHGFNYSDLESSSRSRSRNRNRSSSSSSRSRSSSSRSSSRSFKKYSKKSRRRHRKRSKSRDPLPVRTPRYWPRNAVNNYSTPFVNNTISHPQMLMLDSPPRSFSTNDVRMGLRRRLQVFLDDPNSSSYAVSFALFIALMVILSSFSVIIESLPQFYNHESGLWWKFEALTLIIFTSELGLRCFAHSTSLKQFNRFFWSFSNFIDVIAIAPVFVEVILFKGEGRDTKRFMVFRLFRLIRLLHCYGYSSVLQLSMDAMFIALKKSKDALLAILFFQFFIIIVFSTLIYFVERGELNPADGKFYMDGKESKFDSIPATFWFVAEVITTVGLGDVWPQTVPGKMLSFPLMLFGLLIIALPSIVLGKNFAEAWLWLKTSGNIQKQQQKQQLALLQKSKKRKSLNKKKPLEAGKAGGVGPSKTSTAVLGKIDENSSGTMTARDFATKMESSAPGYSTTIDIDRMERGGGQDDNDNDNGNNDNDNDGTEGGDEEAQNGETVQSTDQPYFVSTAALIESENQSEILQLVQMLVEQFQHNTEVIERLARQQDNLVGTVSVLKRAQMKISGVSDPNTETERSRSRSRSRSYRSRSRSKSSRSRSKSNRGRRSRSRSRSYSRSRSPSYSRSIRSSKSRGRSRSVSLSRLARSRSRSRSPSRGRSRGKSCSSSRHSDTSHSRHRHRRRVSSCSSCEERDKW